MNEVFTQVKELPLFAALSDSQYATLAAKSRVVKLQKSEALFRAGDHASCFYVVTHGSLKLAMHSPQGIEKVLTIVRPIEQFAEAVMFMEKHQYPVSAIALENSEVISFDNKTFVAFLRESTDLSLRMLGLLSQRLHRQVTEIENLSTQNSTSRVVHYLSSLITEQNGNSTTITLDTSKKNLASQLSITPETFSRILNKMATEKLIKIAGRRIEIIDIAQFKSYLICNKGK